MYCGISRDPDVAGSASPADASGITKGASSSEDFVCGGFEAGSEVGITIWRRWALSSRCEMRSAASALLRGLHRPLLELFAVLVFLAILRVFSCLWDFLIMAPKMRRVILWMWVLQARVSGNEKKCRISLTLGISPLGTTVGVDLF